MMSSLWLHHLTLIPHSAAPAPRSFVIKKAEQRYRELDAMGISVRLICVGRKGSAYFKRRPQYKIEGERRGAAAMQGHPCVKAGAGRAASRHGLCCPSVAPWCLGASRCTAHPARRPAPVMVAATFEVGQSPTIKEAQAIADDIFADFVSEVGAWFFASQSQCPASEFEIFLCVFAPQR